MSDKQVYLIAGLGNPGEKYQNTRHNVGFLVIDYIATSYGISINQHKFQAELGRGIIEGKEVILVKPLSFMNLSGYPISQIGNYFRITGGNMLIIHDDIDLPLGRMKLKEKGGHGGHRGIKSIIEMMGGGDFCRLRIGVGRSEANQSVADYVLSPFRTEELPVLNQIMRQARDAVVAFLSKGIKECMTQFNNHRLVISS